MKRYRTTFERINTGVQPFLKQTADVIFTIDADYSDAQHNRFVAAAWDACFEQNPHWKNAAGPACVAAGWSSVIGGHKFVLVDDVVNLCVVWHIGAESWLKQDGVNTTEDVEQAGHFTPSAVAALKELHLGSRFPLVAPKFLSEVHAEQPSKEDGPTLEIIRDEFVLWGYGDLTGGDYLHTDRARTPITDSFAIDFELPEQDGYMGQAREYQRRTSWAWRYNFGNGGHGWKLAASLDEAINAAKEEALKNMRSTGYHSCHQWLAYKNNMQINDLTTLAAVPA